MKSISDELRNILDNSNISFEIWSIDNDHCEVYVNWGDWKHEHMVLMYILTNNDYDFEREVIDENDSDCFSAKYSVSRNIAQVL